MRRQLLRMVPRDCHPRKSYLVPDGSSSNPLIWPSLCAVSSEPACAKLGCDPAARLLRSGHREASRLPISPSLLASAPLCAHGSSERPRVRPAHKPVAHVSGSARGLRAPRAPSSAVPDMLAAATGFDGLLLPCPFNHACTAEHTTRRRGTREATRSAVVSFVGM